MVVLWLTFCAVLNVIYANKEEKVVGDNIGLLGILSTEPSPPSLLKTYDGPTKHPIFTSKTCTSAYKGFFNDPAWDNMWYVQDYRIVDMPVMDLNVVPVYKQGITGKGVTIAVIDSGFDHAHLDLSDNYLMDLSYNPYTKMKEAPVIHGSNHGTMSGSVIAMVANNTRCGVGIAFNSKIAGILNMFRGNPFIKDEYNNAMSLTANLHKFDIYSNSWGVNDDGKTMVGMGLNNMSRFAMNLGAAKGRKGKGAIYTFASGNGGETFDHCGADYLVNFEQSIAIAAASQFGKISKPGERCASIFATAYGGFETLEEQNIASLAIGNRCGGFRGTSAATPLASGIIALALETNPNLSDRDMMHIITMGSEVAPLADNKDTWFKNGRGFWVSEYFGFGLMNAWNMVKLAQQWKTVPKKRSCVFSMQFQEPEKIKVRELKNITIDVDACKGTEHEVNYLETIEVASTISYAYRGSLSLYLISPAGTKVMLLGNRPKDHDHNGLKDWIIKSVHTWGEDPRGKWRIQVYINDKPQGWRSFFSPTGKIKAFRFAIHGTKEQPEHYKKSRVRTYAAFRLPNGRTSED